MIKITPNDIKRIDRWVLAAKEFANEYDCVIYLETYTNSTGECILVELCHVSDEKSKANYRSPINQPSTQSLQNILGGLYNKLPIVRRKGIYYAPIHTNSQSVWT